MSQPIHCGWLYNDLKRNPIQVWKRINDNGYQYAEYQINFM